MRLAAIGFYSMMIFAAAASAQGARKEAPRCVPGPGASGAPRNVEQAVDLINTLPRPVTIPCLVESLDRPLQVFATRSAASLQPSTSRSDPRFFIFSLPLLISVTSDGPGADLVEMSVLEDGNRRSLKAEIRFPVSEKVPYALPYSRIDEGMGTNCGFFCHTGEARDPRIAFANAFVSRAIRPSPALEVSLASLQKVLSGCAPSAKTPRCELLRAVLARGPVLRAEFPSDMPAGF